jgi:hypothetical protein
MDFINKRLEYSGVGNPLFITDIVNANESLLTAMQSICGLGATDFRIISGLEYSTGAYSAGIIYYNGLFYNCLVGLVENKYLTISTSDIETKIYSDSSTHATYRCYYATQSNIQYGTIPVFTGDMNSYRLNLAFLNTSKIGYTDIADDLITSSSIKVLSAKQGKNLNDKITGLETNMVHIDGFGGVYYIVAAGISLVYTNNYAGGVVTVELPIDVYFIGKKITILHYEGNASAVNFPVNLIIPSTHALYGKTSISGSITAYYDGIEWIPIDWCGTLY